MDRLLHRAQSPSASRTQQTRRRRQLSQGFSFLDRYFLAGGPSIEVMVTKSARPPNAPLGGRLLSFGRGEGQTQPILRHRNATKKTGPILFTSSYYRYSWIRCWLQTTFQTAHRWQTRPRGSQAVVDKRSTRYEDIRHVRYCHMPAVLHRRCVPHLSHRIIPRKDSYANFQLHLLVSHFWT